MIFLYHGIVPDFIPTDRWCVGQAIPVQSFERHLRWLQRRFRVVALDQYLDLAWRKKNGGRGMVTITFDDGVETAFRLVYPVLKAAQVPATFFVAMSHLNKGPLLWFNLINALCFEGAYTRVAMNGETFSLDSREQRVQARHGLGRMAVESGNVQKFGEQLRALYPLPESIKAMYEGMTYDQLSACGREGLVEIGAHTLSHPLLSQVDESNHAKEVLECKNQLSSLTGKPVRYFAYPGGDYTAQTLRYVEQAGYEAAFCTIPRTLGSDPILEIERIGVYSPPLYKLWLKALGIVPVMRRIGFSAG